MSAGFGSTSSERPAAERDFGTPGAGAQATAEFSVTPGEILRVRVGGWGGEAVGSTPGAGGWNGGGAGGEALDRRGKAGSGGGGATDVRRGGDGLEHRIIVAAGGSGGAGGAIGGPIGTGGGNGGDLIGHEGLRRPRVGEPSDRRARAERRQPVAPRVGTLPISRSRRRRAPSGWAATAPQGSPAAAVAVEAGSTVAVAAVPAAPSAAATAAAARASVPQDAIFRAGVGVGFGRATISYDRDTRC